MKYERRLIIITIFVAGLLFAGGAFINHYIKRRLEKKLVTDYAAQEAIIGKEVATTLQNRVKTVESTLQVLALNKDIQSLDPKVCNPAIEKAFKELKINIGNIARVNEKGVFYCSINKSIIGLPASKFGNYVQTLINDPKHNTVVSPAVNIPNVKGKISAIHVPVFSVQGKFAGTIGGAIYFNQLATDYLDKIVFAKSGFAGLQDNNGEILYAHIKSNIGKNFFSDDVQAQFGKQPDFNQAIRDAWQGKNTTVHYKLRGDPKIGSITSAEIVPGHRWVVIVNVPEREISELYLQGGLNSAFNVVLIVLGASISLILIIMGSDIVRSNELQKAKDQFVSLVSHQLRTPLTSIRLFSEMLEDKQVGELNPSQTDYVKNISISTERMIRLVGDILNTSRIELHRIKVNPAPTDLINFIKSFIEEVRPLADEKKVILKFKSNVESTPKIPLDQTLLGQVVHNLLTNAIRYTNQKDGVVEVSVSQKGQNYQLDVRDNGIGIPPKAQKKVFHQFYRAQNAIRVEGEGTGLGLYLVKMICQVTGCKISFYSKENEGTTFSVTIPMKGMESIKGDKSLS